MTARKKKPLALDDLLRMYLETGFDMFGDFEDRRTEPDPDWQSRTLAEIEELWLRRPKPEIRGLWEQHRSEIMKAWLADPEHPTGSLPWAAKEFDLPCEKEERS